MAVLAIVRFEARQRLVLILLRDIVEQPLGQQSMQQPARVVRLIEQDVVRQRDKGEAIGFRAADPSHLHCLLVQAQQSSRIAQVLERDVTQGGRLAGRVWYRSGRGGSKNAGGMACNAWLLAAW